MASNYLDNKFTANTSLTAEPNRVPLSPPNSDYIDDGWISPNIARVGDIDEGGGSEFTIDPAVRTASFTANAGSEHRVSAASNVTVTLPVGPIDGSRVRIVGVGVGDANIILNSAGATVDHAFTSGAANLTFRTQGLFLELEFTAAGGRWHSRGDQPSQWFAGTGGLRANSVVTTRTDGIPAVVTLTNDTVLGRTAGNIAPLAISSLGVTTRRYLDVLCCATGALPAHSTSGPTLTATANGALTLDGVAVTTAQLVLVTFETDPAKSGVYYVINAGGGAAAWSMTRLYLSNGTSGGENIFRVLKGNIYQGYEFRYNVDTSRFISIPRVPPASPANVGSSRPVYPDRSYLVVNSGPELALTLPPFAMDVLDSPRLTVKNSENTEACLISTTGGHLIEDPSSGQFANEVGLYGLSAAATWVGRPGEYGLVFYCESRSMTGFIPQPVYTHQISASDTAIPNSRYLVDTTGGAVTITLPDPMTATLGVITIKKYAAAAANVTIAGGGHNIDGAPSVVLSTPWSYVSLVSDGNNWAKV